MSFLKGWTASVLLISIAVFYAWFTNQYGGAWHAFAYPFPILRENFEALYLADFSYLAFLAVTIFWLARSRVAPERDYLQKSDKLTMDMAAFCFALISIDYLKPFIPRRQNCVNDIFHGMLALRCDYSPDFRNALAIFTSILLIVGLVLAYRNRNAEAAIPGDGF